jgi:hypothetical protein
MHGHFLQALAYNPRTVLVLPFVAAWLARHAWTALRGAPPPGPLLSVRARWAFVAAVVAFGVLRNVPAFPFTLLAPHILTPPAASSGPPPGPSDTP